MLPLFESGIPLLKERIAQLQDVTIAYPDEGAWKRFHSQFEQYPEVRWYLLPRHTGCWVQALALTL